MGRLTFTKYAWEEYNGVWMRGLRMNDEMYMSVFVQQNGIPKLRRRPTSSGIAIFRDEGGEYISVDDLQARSKASSAVIDTLREAGALSGLPESSQTTLF